MIIDGFLWIIYGLIYLLSAPLRLFDDVAAPAWLSATVSGVQGYLSAGYNWFPSFLTTLFLTWGVYAIIELSIFTYKGIRWIYQKIPGVN